MDKEWEEGSWGRRSAQEFAALGFAVVRVPSIHWRDIKAKDPGAFRNPYVANETEQQMICTIVMRDTTGPLIKKVMQDMDSGVLSSDLRDWNPTVWDLELPKHEGQCVPRRDVIAVTEASALVAPGVTPRVVRSLYGHYPHRLL